MQSLKNRSLIVFAAMCMLVLSVGNIESAAGASVADLAGTWNFCSFVSGPGAPWWERLTMTIQPNGKFTGSGTESPNGTDKFSGSFLLLSSGAFEITSAGRNLGLCQMDLGKTVMACTSTWNDKSGTADLIIGTKQAASYSKADLAGKWQGNFLLSPGPFWIRTDETIKSNGEFTAPLTFSEGPGGSIYGTLSISPSGEITDSTCHGAYCPESNYATYMDAGKTVIVGTDGASTKTDTAALTVYTKMASSYSMYDLVGIWHANILASGPGAPWWERATVTIKPDGTFSVSGVENNGSSDSGKGTLSISSAGVITVKGVKSSDLGMVMNAGKTVMVETNTWSGKTDPGTTEIGIWTKSAGLPGAPTEVSAKAGNAQAKVSFTAPAANGSAITSYTVTPSVGAAVKGESSPITVKGLTNGKSYTFTVTATNGIGTGLPSKASKAIIPEK
jgi:hypothetical protein